MIELTSKQLRHAANIKDKIDSLQKELQRLLRSNGSAIQTKAAPKKRKMSVAARKKISVAAKARWAKVRAGKK